VSLPIQDAAWLSGFIDGEGSVAMRRLNMDGKTYYQAVFRVNHCHEVTVIHLKSLLDRLSLQYGEFATKRKGNQSPAWTVTVTGQERLLRLADVVEPYTVTKVLQWATIREWCESRLATPHKAGYTDRQLELAAIGVTMNRRGIDRDD
jgi:hypothetical protein